MCNSFWDESLFNALRAESTTNDDLKKMLFSLESVKLIDEIFKRVFLKEKIENRTENIQELDKVNKIRQRLEIIQDFALHFHSKGSFNFQDLVKQSLEDSKKNKANGYQDCDKTTSMHQRIYLPYKCISSSILNGYALILKYLGKNLSTEQTNSRDELDIMNTINSFANDTKKKMEYTSRILRRCDPLVYIKGSNYNQLENFIFSQPIGKDYLYKNRVCGMHSCSQFIQVNSPNDLPASSKFSCNGTLHNCRSVKINDICFPENNIKYRPYQAFKSPNGETYGQWTDVCNLPNNTQKFTSLTKSKIVIFDTDLFHTTLINVDCDICLCDCNNKMNKKSVRKFSLQKIYSRSKQGVVTGIKLDIKNHVVHFVIRTGNLVNGVVNSTKQQWSTWHHDHKIQSENSTIELSYEWRNMILDNIEAPPGTFIQGVKFIKCFDGVSISILATKVNKFGQLRPKTAAWFSNCDEFNSIERQEVRIPENPDVPIKSKSESIVRSKPNTFVKFQTTGWNVDASQTVVPFFDTQALVTNPPEPIGGIGLYYKSSENYGGFIGPQLITFDYTYLMNDNFTVNQFNNSSEYYN